MEILLTVAVVVVPAAGGLGSQLRWHQPAGALARRILLALLWVLVPFVTFFNLARASVSLDDGIGLAPAYVSISIAGVAAYFVATRLLKLPRASAGAVITCSLVANPASLGYPLIVAVLGSDELTKGFVYDITVSLPVLLIGAFGVGAAFGDKAGDGPRERVIAFFTRNRSEEDTSELQSH